MLKAVDERTYAVLIDISRGPLYKEMLTEMDERTYAALVDISHDPL